ncbi:MAG TPA: cytidylate kinase-like family protein [Lacunisphaera sp.]
MTTHPYLHQGLSILHARLKSPQSPLSIAGAVHPFVTLSWETCAGATTLGHQLLPLLNQHIPEEGRSWMFLDKDLINQALSLNHLPDHLADYLPEDRLPEIKGLIGEMVGLHPPLWELEHRVTEAILKLAQLGCVILAGRAANLITRDLPGGFHLRLVTPRESRIKRAQVLHNLSHDAAEKFLRDNDSARERHMQTHFEQDINDPRLYDLVINTDRIAPATAARLVVETMRERLTVASPA